MCGDSDSLTLKLKVSLPPRPTAHIVPFAFAVPCHIYIVYGSYLVCKYMAAPLTVIPIST